MYIRHRIIKGIKYFYVAKCRREGSKVIQENLCYLGIHPTIDDCMAYHQDMIKKCLAGIETETNKRKKATLKNQYTRSQEKIKELTMLRSV